MQQVRLGTASPWGAVSGSDGAGSGLRSHPRWLPAAGGGVGWGIPYLPQVSCLGSTPHTLLAALILFEGGRTHLHFTSNSLWLQPANHSSAHLPASSELSPPTLSLSRHRVRSALGRAWGGAGDQPWTGQRDPPRPPETPAYSGPRGMQAGPPPQAPKLSPWSVRPRSGLGPLPPHS